MEWKLSKIDMQAFLCTLHVACLKGVCKRERHTNNFGPVLTVLSLHQVHSGRAMQSLQRDCSSHSACAITVAVWWRNILLDIMCINATHTLLHDKGRNYMRASPPPQRCDTSLHSLYGKPSGPAHQQAMFQNNSPKFHMHTTNSNTAILHTIFACREMLES